MKLNKRFLRNLLISLLILNGFIICLICPVVKVVKERKFNADKKYIEYLGDIAGDMSIGGDRFAYKTLVWARDNNITDAREMKKKYEEYCEAYKAKYPPVEELKISIGEIMSIKATGYCWKCGRVCKGLFCSVKHQRQYEMAQDRKIIKGKKAGYGLAGSTH